MLYDEIRSFVLRVLTSVFFLRTSEGYTDIVTVNSVSVRLVEQWNVENRNLPQGQI